MHRHDSVLRVGNIHNFDSQQPSFSEIMPNVNSVYFYTFKHNSTHFNVKIFPIKTPAFKTEKLSIADELT